MNPGDKIDVLDHGFVRYISSMGSDLDIVRAARVSYAADWRTGDNESADQKLIAYLIRNKHTSPFESVVFTFEIKCPIFIARQWHRHRTWSYNEISARYTELPNEYYVPEIENITKQNKDNKQMRTNEQNENAYGIQQRIKLSSTAAFLDYQELLHVFHCPRELARSILPINTYTRFFGTVNLHNLLHFLRLRLHPHAQWEIQRYAIAIMSIVHTVVPIVCKEFCDSLDETTSAEFKL